MAENVQSVEGGQAAVVNNDSSLPAKSQESSNEWIKRSEVNDIVHGRIQEVSRRSEQTGYERAMAELKSQQQPQNNQQQSAANMGGVQEKIPTGDEIRRMVTEEADRRYSQEQQRTQEEHYRKQAEGIVSSFSQKMEEGAKRYPDFEEKVAQLNFQKVPFLIPLLNSVDNAADVAYDLADNPEKVGLLLASLEKADHIALMQVKKLSSSIAKNVGAASARKANEPLSQVTPSTLGTDSGELTVSDLRKRPEFRG